MIEGRNWIAGGKAHYGHVAGILMIDSTIPRLPGDPGHAETFDFPVLYGVLKDFPFSDLVELKKENIQRVIDVALELQQEGVLFVVADCGLFAPLQKEISESLHIPFIGSSLSLVPLIKGSIPSTAKIGILTGDTRILKQEHLTAAGIEPEWVVMEGMEGCDEFRHVVLERANRLDVQALKQGTIEAAVRLCQAQSQLKAIVLECTNLISFRYDIQKATNTPVYDLVSLIELWMSGFRLKRFGSRFLSTL